MPDVFFMTMGMAEVFRNKQSGKIACQKPGYAKGGGEEQTEFHMSSYEENYANLRRIVEIITQVRPDARIVFTVSPVPLARTFSDNDIVAANTEGKSILRAAIGAIARGEEVIIAHHDTVIESGDHVIMFIVEKNNTAALERLFQVGVSFI